jgi:hypothetical protein
MNEAELLDKVETLQNVLLAQARGSNETATRGDPDYCELRTQLMQDEYVWQRLPRFVRTCRDLKQFWAYIKSSYAHYSEREGFVREQFVPLIDELEAKNLRKGFQPANTLMTPTTIEPSALLATLPSSGVDLSSSGNSNIQGDVVGRDKIVTIVNNYLGQDLPIPSRLPINATRPAQGSGLLAQFQARDNQLEGSKAARSDQVDGLAVLDFSASDDRVAEFSGTLSPVYRGSGIRIRLYLSMSSATAGAVRWDVSIRRNLMSDRGRPFGSSRSVLQSCPPVHRENMVVEVSFANGSEMDEVRAGDPFVLRIERNATHPSDTAAGDAELVAIEVFESSI